MPKIQEVNGRFSITIPKDFMEQCGLVKGDSMTVSFNERGNLEFRKVKR